MKSKIVRIFLSISGHIVALSLVIFSWFHLVKFYLNQFPPIGADFYQFVNFADYIHKFPAWPSMSWKYIWFSGHPTFFDYGMLHSYLVLPLINFFTVTDASRFYLIGTLGVFLVFTYLLIWELSKNKIFSIALTLCLAWSTNLYVALFFGGTAAYAGAQMFLPMVLYFVVKFCKTNNRRFLYLAGILLGLSFWGHTGLAVSLIFASACLVLFFWKSEKIKIFSLKKIKDLLTLIISAFFVAGFALYPTIYSLLSVSQKNSSGFGLSLSTRVFPNAITEFIQMTNPFLFIALLVVLVVFIFRRRLKKIEGALTFIILSIYLFIFIALFLIGRNPVGNALGPDRVNFTLSLSLACLLAVLWRALGGRFILNLKEFKKQKRSERIFFYLRLAIIVILLFGIFEAAPLERHLEEKKGNSSLMPVEINDTLINENERISSIVPPWLDTNDNNHRLYELNNSINIWWNIVNDLPIVKGYFPVMPSQDAVNWLYWGDQSLIGEIVEHFNTPEEVAKNSALFMIDWFGVKYLHNIGAPFDVADYLLEKPGFVENIVEDIEEIEFIEVADEFTSPIVRPVNSPTFMVIADNFSYDTILRILAMENLNSKVIIPLHGEELIDRLKKENLSHFDGIFLYNYQYKSQGVWDVLENYVRNGGNLMIETGSEVKESDVKNIDNKELPNIFPIRRTTRDELGTEWSLEKGDSLSIKNIKIDEFSPLLYNNSPWKLSFSIDSDLRSWSQVILRQQGKPILVEGDFGDGKVIWSGMNLPYHIQTYQNFEESGLFKSLLGSMFNLEERKTPNFEFSRDKPEEVKISSKSFSGVLMKENAYPGWQAQAGGEKLKIYKAGLDFIYVRNSGEENVVTLSYRGSKSAWIFFWISIASFIYLVLGVIFGRLLLAKMLVKKISADKINNKLKSWWDKDEEEE